MSAGRRRGCGSAGLRRGLRDARAQWRRRIGFLYQGGMAGRLGGALLVNYLQWRSRPTALAGTIARDLCNVTTKALLGKRARGRADAAPPRRYAPRGTSPGLQVVRPSRGTGARFRIGARGEI